MRRYQQGAHTRYDLKVHLVWVPKYRKRVLTGQVAIRARDVLRQIAIEHEITVITGKVAPDHVHMFVSYRPSQDIAKIVQYHANILQAFCKHFETMLQSILQTICKDFAKYM